MTNRSVWCFTLLCAACSSNPHGQDALAIDATGVDAPSANDTVDPDVGDATSAVDAHTDDADPDVTVIPPVDAGPPSAWITQRLVPDRGFEEAMGTAPVAWTTNASAPNTVALVDGGHTGAHALRTTDGDPAQGCSALSEPLAVIPGETLTVSVWARRVTGRAGTIYLEFRDRSGTRIDSAIATGDVTSATGWQSVRAMGTAPATALTATIRIYSALADTGTTDWDDITITSTVPGGYREALGSGAVLFVGDQRVESYAGIARTMHPGTKRTDPALASIGTGVVLAGTAGAWDANPRVQGTVLPAPDGNGYRMWFTASEQTGYATSADGIAWDRSANPASGGVWNVGTGGVVENPAFAGSGARYFMLFTDKWQNDNLGTRHYIAAQSPDGVNWSRFTSAGVPGWDVVNVTYDPASQRFVAMAKDWGATTFARRVTVSTSADFVTWSTPRVALTADAVDQQLAREHNAQNPTTPTAEIYGMPAIRYGEQFLGLPWVFEITENFSNPGNDVGPVRTQLAASLDLLHWNRPDRTPIVTPGASGTWDYGQIYTGTTFVVVGDVVRLYYGAASGLHSQGGRFRTGLVEWPLDRFSSWHSNGTGHVVTRTISPPGSFLFVNADTSHGSLRAEILDADGSVVPGYAVDDSIPFGGDSLSQRLAWTAHDTLPTQRPLRIRFVVADGDLYAYHIE